jgi:hypothetical protein
MKEIFELTNPTESKENLELAKKRRATFYEAMNKLATFEQLALSRGTRLNMAEVGAEAGKAYIKYIASRQDDPKIIQSANQEIRTLLPRKQAEEFIAGFLAEHAVAYALSQELGKEVYYTEEDDDTKQKIDWIVKEPGEAQEILLQVKTLPLTEDDNSKKLIFPINSATDIKIMADSLYSYRYNGEPSIGHYFEKAEQMYNTNTSRDGKLVFFIVPPYEINPYSGTFANKEFVLQLDNEFADL